MNRHNPPPLRLTLALIVALLVAIHLSLDIGLEVLIEQPRQIEKRQSAAAQQLIDDLRQTLQIALAFGNRDMVQQIIEVQTGNPHVDLLALIDQQGRILHSTQGGQPMETAAELIADFEPERFLRALQRQSATTDTLPSGEAVTAYAPLLLSGATDGATPRRDGALFLRYDLARARADALRDRLNPSGVISWLLSLVVSAMSILYLLGLWIGRPLRKLEKIVGQVARDEPAQQSGFLGGGEIAQLGIGIDHMRRDIEISKAALQGANRELEHHVAERTRHLEREISLREKAEALLSASERQLQIVLNSVTDGVALWNDERKLQYANPAFRSLIGMHSGEDKLVFDEVTLLGPDGETLPTEEFPIMQTLRDDQPRTGVIVALQRPGAGPRWLNVNVIPVTQGTAAESGGVVASVTDITELKSHESLLDKLANFDALTNLPNRRLLHDRMRQLVEHARRKERVVAICLLDLDGFKEVNDRYGHKCGDQLLIEAAGRLSNCVRAGDTVARLGGDEFVLLLTDIDDAGECETILQRVLHALSNPYTLNGEREQGISASIGVTLFPLDDSDTDTLLRHADQAMYAAKRAGKNRFHWFDAGQENRVVSQRGMLNEIAQALRSGDLFLLYQPKISCATLRVVGVEALLRWRHPRLGILPPSNFLPLVEDEEIALRIGDYIVRQAMQQAFDWKKSGINLPVSVNLFARQLQQRGFVESLEQAQQEVGGSYRTPLEIEIIENAALEGIRDLPRLVARCAEIDITFSLDDFGTGYSTLDHLRRIPAQTLKIDRSFIKQLLNSEADRTLVAATIGLGRAFGRRIVAEGVEQVAQLHWLREAGCDEMQGFLLAEPMDPEKLLHWLKSYRPAPEWLPSAAPGKLQSRAG